MPSELSVTIIVPALNEEKYIREAIGSLIPIDLRTAGGLGFAIN